MIKVTITNDILNSIIEIELNRYKMSLVELSQNVLNKLRKNSKKKVLMLQTRLKEILCLKNRQKKSLKVMKENIIWSQNRK